MRIVRKHAIGAIEAKRRVDNVADEIVKKYSLTTKWDGDNLIFTGSGISGQICVADSEVCFEAKLGFVLAVLETTIHSEVSRTMDEEFNA